MVEIEVVELKTQRVMRGPAVCRYLGGISMAQLYRLIKSGEFPPPISIGDGAKGWPIEVADQFIERRKAIAYTLRHTTGSWLVQKNMSTRKVAEILGTSEAMIEKHYGHLAPDHLRDEVAMIGRRG